MPRPLKVAAVQMDAAPAPKAKRLERAAKLIAQATEAGAQLVALPELFSIGYEYSDASYEHPETLAGATVTWMREQAAKHQIHLAGTLLLLDGDHVYNSALLIAPDGRHWRYDKQYPFVWERAYFREGKGITIAETDLGKIGLLICWDAAHPDAWARYAGRVDAMLIMSSPPCINEMDICYADGTRLSVTSPDQHFADGDMEAQASWLRVPVIHASASGHFRSDVPMPMLSLAPFVLASPMGRQKFDQVNDAWIEAAYDHHTRIIDELGEVQAKVTQDGDSFTLATLELPDTRPQPDTSQPTIHTTPTTLFQTDVVSPLLLIPMYRSRLRRQWGASMAPIDNSTLLWAFALGIVFFIGWIFGKRK
jgi:predicted amidohydrolase